MKKDMCLISCMAILFVLLCIAPTHLSLEVKNHNSEKFLLNGNFARDSLNGEDENFNCFIVGRATHTGFIIPAQHGQGDVIFRNGHILSFGLPLSWFENKSISFGYKFSCDGQPREKYPSRGWIWTKGSNGVKTWDGDSLWGNLGKKEFIYWNTFGEPHFDDFWFYTGVKGFTGIRIGGFRYVTFFGTASHVNIVTEYPGKNSA